MTPPIPKPDQLAELEKRANTAHEQAICTKCGYTGATDITGAHANCAYLAHVGVSLSPNELRALIAAARRLRQLEGEPGSEDDAATTHEVEQIAKMLWERFSLGHCVDWGAELHKAEYRSVASDVLRSPFVRRATTLSQAERERIRNEAFEEAARLIDENIILDHSAGEKSLRKRPNDEVSNLAYAKAIRALKSPEPQTNQGDCPVCGADCSAANPPITHCPLRDGARND